CAPAALLAPGTADDCPGPGARKHPCDRSSAPSCVCLSSPWSWPPSCWRAPAWDGPTPNSAPSPASNPAQLVRSPPCDSPSARSCGYLPSPASSAARPHPWGPACTPLDPGPTRLEPAMYPRQVLSASAALTIAFGICLALCRWGAGGNCVLKAVAQ